MKEIGIYVHIPFCVKKCEYCDFVSYANKEEAVPAYIESLKKEIKTTKKEVKEEYVVKTIYIGGGTPSFIAPRYMKDILDHIRKSWKVSNKCEITIEVNPGTVDEDKLKEYYDFGINRISIGMQAVDNDILKIIGRIHTYEEFLECYKFAQKAGFKNINVDVMIGLPTQRVNGVEEATDKLLKLEPNHISIYSLILEEDTNLEKRVKNQEIFLVNEDEEREMYWIAKRKLEDAGYIHYEISNFAKKGYESAHNLDCWNQHEYIGFGVAAHSYLNKKRYSNTKDLKKYIAKAKENVFEKEIHEIQTEEAEQKEYMMLGLRKISGVKISEFKNKFIENPLYIFRNELHKLAVEDLIEIDEDDIRLTDKGLDLANQVWEEFL